MKCVFFDMDGTLAEWRVSAKPEEILKPGYFRTLAPQETLTRAIQEFLKDERFLVFSMSHYIPGGSALDEKKAWLDEFVPHLPKGQRLFCPCGVNKGLFVEDVLRRRLTKSDILVDDYSNNCMEWENAGGTAIKWINGINGKKHTFNGIRCNTTENLCEILAVI